MERAALCTVFTLDSWFANMQEERYITDIDTPENRAIVEEILQKMQKDFNDAADFAKQKMVVARSRESIERLMQSVRTFFAKKARHEDAWPKISIADLAKHLALEKQIEQLHAACAMMRVFGQVLDTRGERGEIEEDVVYPLIRPLYEPSVLKTVRQTVAGAGGPFMEYCWFNNMNHECWYRVRREEENGIPTVSAIDGVADFVTQRVNELVRQEMLRQFDTTGATVH